MRKCITAAMATCVFVACACNSAEARRGSRQIPMDPEFARLDVNRNSELTADEYCGLGGHTPTEFMKLDTNRSGGISKAEYVNGGNGSLGKDGKGGGKSGPKPSTPPKKK